MGGPGSGGSNKKSAEQHRLEGTFRPGRHGPRLVRAQPAGDAPSPPDSVSAAGLKLWRDFVEAHPSRFADDLSALVTLEAIVRASDRRDQARALIARDGLVLEGARGGQRVHPMWRVEHTATMDMLKALRDLRLEAAEEPAPEEADPFDEFAGLNPLQKIQRQAAARRRGRGQ